MSKLILIVDDDVQLRNTLSENLKKLGFSILSAENGKECLQILEKQTPDIILIDYFMPIMDGETTIKFLQQNFKNPIPLILMSSDKVEIPGILFLRKPFVLKDLLEIINNIVATKYI